MIIKTACMLVEPGFPAKITVSDVQLLVCREGSSLSAEFHREFANDNR